MNASNNPFLIEPDDIPHADEAARALLGRVKSNKQKPGRKHLQEGTKSSSVETKENNEKKSVKCSGRQSTAE